ncbi:MAG: hypothetical protein LLG01_08665 [Planctomycetaceae bacterium]|nr:hypothetical protein [Planctomycetaceae bacterium]
MAAKKHNELAAGVFVLAALAVLVGVLLWLGAGTMFTHPAGQSVFYAKVGSGSVGLTVGSEAKINDESIGRVSRIEYKPSQKRTLYFVEVWNTDRMVHADGKANVPPVLVGQAPLVVTDRGSEQAPLADVDHPVEITTPLDRVMSNIEAATADVRKIAQSMQRELDPTNNQGVLAKTKTAVTYIEGAASGLNEITQNILPQTDAKKKGTIMANIAEASASLAQATSAIESYGKKDMGEILASARKAAENVVKITADFTVVSGQAKKIVDANSDNISEIVDNLTRMSTSLKIAGEEIRRNPWRLLHKPDKDELAKQNLYDAARAFAAGAGELDQASVRLAAMIKQNPQGVAAQDPQVQKVRDTVAKAMARFKEAEETFYQELKKGP